jgi:hypothetical protein
MERASGDERERGVVGEQDGADAIDEDERG